MNEFNFTNEANLNQMGNESTPNSEPTSIAKTNPPDIEKRTEFEILKAKFKADFKNILDELTPLKDDKRIAKYQISAIKSFRKRLASLIAIGIKPDAIFTALVKKGFSISREQFAKIISGMVNGGGDKNANAQSN